MMTAAKNGAGFFCWTYSSWKDVGSSIWSFRPLAMLSYSDQSRTRFRRRVNGSNSWNGLWTKKTKQNQRATSSQLDVVFSSSYEQPAVTQTPALDERAKSKNTKQNRVDLPKESGVGWRGWEGGSDDAKRWPGRDERGRRRWRWMATASPTAAPTVRNFIAANVSFWPPPPFPLHQFYHRRKCKRAPQPHTLLLFFFPFNASSFSNAKSIESKKDDILKFGRGTVRSGPLFFLVRLRSFLSRIWEWPMFIRIVKGSPPFLIPIFSSFGIRAQRTRNFFSGSTDEFGFCGEAARHRSGLLCVSAPPSCRLSVMDGPTLIARHGPTWPAGGSVTGRRVATVNSRSCCWHTRLPSVFRFCFFVFFWGGGAAWVQSWPGPRPRIEPGLNESSWVKVSQFLLRDVALWW